MNCSSQSCPWLPRILLLGLVAIGIGVVAGDAIPRQHAARIWEAAPAQPQITPTEPRRVLVFATPPHLMEKDPHRGYCIPYGIAAFEAIGRKTGAFEAVVSDDLAEFLPGHLNQYDAVILNNTSGPWITPTATDMARDEFREHGTEAASVEQVLRRHLLERVHADGMGLVSIHFALAGNAHWPEFRELLGATFTGHPWNQEVAITVEEPDHPVLAAFGGADFRLADEIYEYGDPYDRRHLRVLLSLDPARSNMGVRWIRRTDGDFALAWVAPRGNGRIFNTSFGHRTELYWNPQILQFYLDAVQFVTGDLKGPITPRAQRPVRQIPGSEPVPDLPGFVSLFDGRDLGGWEGDPRIWSVQEGIITGQTTEDVRVTENSFLVWKDEIEDFELRLKFRLEGGNSGVYYRARKRPDGQREGEALVGTQADFSADGRWTGVIMEYTLREILAERGEQVVIDESGVRRVVSRLGDPTDLLTAVDLAQWNEYVVVARGGRVTIAINGVPMAELDDRDANRIERGWLGLQVHTGPPMKVEFKDIFLKRL